MQLTLILSLALTALRAFLKNPKKSDALKRRLESVRDAIDAALATW